MRPTRPDARDAHFVVADGGFTSDPEPDGEGQPSDPVYLKPRAGIAIRKYSFPEENPSFNLYAPFCNRIDYQLA